MQEPTRCAWVSNDPLYQNYHDQEWGVPCFDDRTLFEFLILEGAQAGLSWVTILRKRENYRRLFDDFNAHRIARYDKRKIESLLNDSGIVRNRLKIHSTVGNARAFLDIQAQQGSFTDFIWQFVDGEPIQNCRHSIQDIPASTDQSDRMSRELKKRGFKFVGTTICYAYMQAVGMVNDHTQGCFRYRPISNMNRHL